FARRERSGREPLDHRVGILALAGDGWRYELAVLARRHPGAELLEQPGFVRHEPGFGDPAVGETEDAGFVDVDLLAGRRAAVEVRLVRGLDAEQHADRVALGHDVDDLVLAVRERTAQIGASAREALALRIGGEMGEAAAPALVVRRQYLALDQRFVLAALQVLE